MEKHICLNCGAPLNKVGDAYACPYCRSTYEDDAEERAAVTLKSLMDEERLDRYSKAKKVLYIATHAEYPSAQEVLAAAQAVLAIEDQDVLANVYLFSHDENPQRLNSYLSSLEVAQPIADEILRWLLPSFHRRSGAAIKRFVELNYRDQELTERLTEVEDAIEKLDAGTYEAGMIRDVFVAYSSADMDEVVHIIDLLEENGLTCFAAFRNLRHGKGAAENYLAEIHKAMAACSVFVLLSSPNSLDANCDAVRIELPYLCAHLPEMPRIQYVVKDAPRVSFLVNKNLKAAFPTQERCRDEEDLLTRISGLLSKPVKEAPKANQYRLSVASVDPAQGTAQVAVGEGRVGESVCVSATAKGGFAFAGWYAGPEKVSDDAMYFFAMPEKDVSLIATFVPAEGNSASQPGNVGLGEKPTFSSDGTTAFYGLYPQTRVGDPILVKALFGIHSPEKNGFYLYQGTYYAKTVAKPRKSGSVFDDGTKIAKGGTYWFRCEPIQWKVLGIKDGTCLLLSESVLDVHRFSDFFLRKKDGRFASDYEASEIRAWLNKDFLESAFALDDSALLTTEVDNGASTMNPSRGKFACANTRDKVFLLSYGDYHDWSYGFPTAEGKSNARRARNTDWAMARGVRHATSFGSLYIGGYYWTRSPDSDCLALFVRHDGKLTFESVNYDHCGIRPAITIKIV